MCFYEFRIFMNAHFQANWNIFLFRLNLSKLVKTCLILSLFYFFSDDEEADEEDDDEARYVLTRFFFSVQKLVHFHFLRWFGMRSKNILSPRKPLLNLEFKALQDFSEFFWSICSCEIYFEANLTLRKDFVISLKKSKAICSSFLTQQKEKK